uniref:Uncharacterized protein n=1 Tax=Aureoumbra lagunensis TaxID=44058 RepID=A0A7S3NJU6_9STRA|mmetsp:Transcript_18798/g.22796  ORF Transcript_18798/g.22796 Transcript_18798/m.22796 type:complete len:228 (-) Transcript_18798:111-794(-)|eukprot:CAMPEP_0197311368 /NCGR_PEP_ID=MMETSP0891-20130614/9849_1 /TAXON_ID=44058 ORGANISM="Aureoumbra lagunensis, Strain CCMP1510" /NCGR_SAMPLE_ID=MMETSP0891 /ASSEMBLY_ACC=CAM_ASM_000534 /LENGTH=227 /DNA_ID=CAMNT_0042797447 /DNA_START=205 /DNA_END=888 /DNA_ORIENTATION=-
MAKEAKRKPTPNNKKKKDFKINRDNLTKKEKQLKKRTAKIVMEACIHQKGDKKGEPSGRAMYVIEMDKSLNPAFKEAVACCSFLGPVKFNSSRNYVWTIAVTAPHVFEKWMSLVPNENEFKQVFGKMDVEVSEHYAVPEITIVELDTGKILIDVVPQNALYHHREYLSDGDDALFAYERNVGGVEGFDRYVSVNNMDAEDAIELLNNTGFDISDEDVCEAKLAELGI